VWAGEQSYLEEVLQGVLDSGTGWLSKQSSSDFPLKPRTLGHLYTQHVNKRIINKNSAYYCADGK